jgi:hypothetical protein
VGPPTLPATTSADPELYAPDGVMHFHRNLLVTPFSRARASVSDSPAMRQMFANATVEQ